MSHKHEDKHNHEHVEGNVEFYCEECSKKKYPNKGKYTIKDMKLCTHVKKDFGKEHMWIRIVAITAEGIIGTVNNDPTRDTSPPFGTTVTVKYEEIEDVG